MKTNPDTEAGQIAALTRAGDAPHIVKTDDGRTFLITQNDVAVKEVTNPHDLVLDPPGRIVQAVTVQTVGSLVDYVNAFRGPATRMMADIDANRIVGLLDYHFADTAKGSADHKAAFVSHRVSMQLPFSEEWKQWKAIDGKLMDQEDFALFLEENAPDVAIPSGAELLEVARDIHAVRKVDFRKAIRNGSVERFEYQESTEAMTPGDLQIPAKFELYIPVYFGESCVGLYAFLRWRLVGTDLKIGIQLYRAEHVRQAEFKRIVFDVVERTGCPAQFGKLG